MTNINVLFTLMVCTLLTACNKEKDLLVEENPAFKIINIDGHDFLIKGDLDGQAFVIRHESKVQLNTPLNDDLSSSGRPFFGTYFKLEDPEHLGADILLGITENGASRFEDVVRVGTYGWYGFDLPSQSVGEAFISRISFRDDRGMTSAIWPSNTNPDNYLEITAITPLELDENLSEIYFGKLYKVEGRFAVDLDPWDNSGENPRLTVDYFSAIFYDNNN